jgi:hypothetical protein
MRGLVSDISLREIVLCGHNADINPVTANHGKTLSKPDLCQPLEQMDVFPRDLSPVPHPV